MFEMRTGIKGEIHRPGMLPVFFTSVSVKKPLQ
jgi:hypothetical protein